MFDITSKDYYYMNTFGIQPFANYDEALAHYNSVAPIRGKTVRPLGIRRHHPSASISLDGTTGDDLTNYIEELICVAYADEVFIEEQLEGGVVPSKSNRHYVTEPALSEQTDTVSVSST